MVGPLRGGEADLAEDLQHPAAHVAAELVGQIVGVQHLCHLLTDPVQGRERAHRLLEDHRHGVSAQIAVVLAALMQQVDLAPPVPQHRDAAEAVRRLWQQSHQRLADQRLARTRFADDGDGLAFLDAEGDGVDDGPRRSRHSEADRQIFDRQ